MPYRCIVDHCHNTSCAEKGISLHRLPFFGNNDAECKRRREKWVDFVREKRHFEDSAYTAICSDHFQPQDFQRFYPNLPGQSSKNVNVLRTDEKGICVFPILQDSRDKSSLSKTARRRQVSFVFVAQWSCRCTLFNCILDGHIPCDVQMIKSIPDEDTVVAVQASPTSLTSEVRVIKP